MELYERIKACRQRVGDEKPISRPQKNNLQNTKLWISVILCFLFLVLVTPFEIDMYTPQLFQMLCIMLNVWAVAWFGVLLYLLLTRKGTGENRGLFMGVLLVTGTGHAILGLFFWQCWVCVGVSVVFLTFLFLEKYRNNRKKV